MKKLFVPFLQQAAHMSLDNVSALLLEQGTASLIESVNWSKQFPYKPITEIYLLHTDKSLFIRFNVHGNLLKAVYTEDQSPVFKDSCVEFFCQLPGTTHYLNFEFNCIGTCSASRRKSRYEDVEQLSTDKMQLIKRFPSIGRRAFNELQGNFEWYLTVEIPFQLMGVDTVARPETIRANFYKCADGTDSPHYVSWNPIQTESPDFHCPEYFGEMIFKWDKD